MSIAPNQPRTQRFLSTVIAVWLLFLWAPAAGALDVTVLFFNDSHGHLTPFELKNGKTEKTVGGIARMATLVRRIRDENTARGARTVLVMAGDLLQGTPLSTVFKGAADVDCFNAMGVAAVTIGNHEFDFGLDNFQALVRRARFPFISANIRWRSDGRLLAPERHRIPLGENLFLHVIGVTTPELLVMTRPETVAPLAVDTPVDAVRSVINRLEGRGPVVLLSHCRHRTDRATAAAVPELTAIIAGHDHLLFDPPRREGGVHIYEALDYGRYLGRLDLAIDPETGAVTRQAGGYLPVTEEIPPDPAIAEIVASYEKRLGPRFKETIGTAAVDLVAERSRIRFAETNWGDLVADVVRSASGAQVALVNSGGLRASIYKGPITMSAIYRALPFTNEIVILDLPGAILRMALTRSVYGTREDEDGGFLQVAGIRFRIDGNTPVDITLGDARTPLDDRQTYRVAVPDYLASGGDGYKMFVGRPRIDTGLPMRDVVVEYIRRKGRIAPKVDGRIDR